MKQHIIDSLKNDYEFDELPPETKAWSERLPDSSLNQTVIERVYCPYCKTQSRKREAPLDPDGGHVLCPNCDETIQYLSWHGTPAVELDKRVFYCPNKCNDRTIADTVEIHLADGYYTATCASCDGVCHEGYTRDKQQYEQLKAILETELAGEFDEADNVRMTTSVEVTRR